LTLAAANVIRINVEHRASKRVDQHGNRFWYVAEAWMADEHGTKRISVVDVVFAANP
jgi:hypothetical protein